MSSKNTEQKNNKLSARYYFLNSQKGFTLVEMIMAVAIFSMVMVVGMGALLNVLSANRQAQAIQTAVNNLNLAMEMMSREIRTGYDYHCGDCSGATCIVTKNCDDDSSIAFESYKGSVSDPDDQIIFRFENGILEKSVNSGADFQPLTPEVLDLTGSYFAVSGATKEAAGNKLQPKVLIVVKGVVINEKGDGSSFNLQTTISQRAIDY